MRLRTEPDRVPRCDWGSADPGYLRYHDTEWGRPVRDEHGLFERLSLEAFQSGLSWLTILRKRENFRAAFSNFDPDVVAQFDGSDVERLMSDAGIVRNRRKIEATIANAKGVVQLRASGGFERLVAAHVPPEHARPAANAPVVGATPESATLSKALKQAGFAHVGPTTCFSMWQACGFINDHVVGCRAGDEIAARLG